QQIAAKARTLELPLPGQNPCAGNGQSRESSNREIVVSGFAQAGAAFPLCDPVEEDANQEKSNGKVHEHHMLRVLGKKDGFDVEGTHRFSWDAQRVQRGLLL